MRDSSDDGDGTEDPACAPAVTGWGSNAVGSGGLTWDRTAGFATECNDVEGLCSKERDAKAVSRSLE